jgi:hypothetical protein
LAIGQVSRKAPRTGARCTTPVSETHRAVLAEQLGG